VKLTDILNRISESHNEKLDRIATQQEKQQRRWRDYLSPQEAKPLNIMQTIWQTSTATDYPPDKIERLYQYVENVLTTHKTYITPVIPAERGLLITKEEISSFLENFKVSQFVQMELAGFSLHPNVARKFSYPSNADNVGVLLRMHPTPDGKLYGLALNTIDDPITKYYCVEHEFIRPSSTCAKVKSVKCLNLQNEQTGNSQPYYVIELQDQGYLVQESLQSNTSRIAGGPLVPLREETATVQTAQQAKEMGLFPAPYGKWTDKSGRIVAYTRNGELRMVNDNPTADIDNGEDLFKDRNDNDERAKAISMGNPTTPKPDIFNKVSTAVRPMDATRKTTKTKLSEILQWVLESESSDQAHQLGLRYDHWGYWKDKTGKTVAQTVKGKLVKLPDDFDDGHMEDPDSPKSTPPEPKAEAPKPTSQPQATQQVSPPTAPIEPPSFKQPTAMLSFNAKDNLLGMAMNGVPFTHWNAPTAQQSSLTEKQPQFEIDKWKGVPGTNPNVTEPNPEIHHAAAGCVVMEPDGRVWIVEPTNHYKGTKATFPKGWIDPGLTPQEAAIKETYEESGLQVQIEDFLGYVDTGGPKYIDRYYIAKRVGGSPTDFGVESQGVHLVPLDQVGNTVNQYLDKQLYKQLQEYVKKKGTSQPPSQPQQSAPKLTDKEIMGTKVGHGGGSAGATAYKGTDGKTRWVKFYQENSKAQSESLVNKLYREVGLDAPESQTFDHNGKIGYAGSNVGGIRLDNVQMSKELANQILDGFVMDVFTFNYDALGLGYDNMKILPNGKVSRIDNGGSTLFRATDASGRKDTKKLTQLGEWDSLFDSSHYGTGNYPKLFKTAGIPNANALGKRAIDQIQQLLDVEKKYGGWEAYINATEPDINPADKAQIINMFNARTQLLKQKQKELSSQQQGNP
jgi:ADP-ribose pyrophosphatase YjhB (NUDIX family)